MVQKINTSEFNALVLESDNPVIVDFGAAWCGPCKKVAPIIAALADELKGQADFYEVDAGVEPGLAQQHAVMSLPTILMFKGGEVKERIIGVASKEKILAKINTLF